MPLHFSAVRAFQCQHNSFSWVYTASFRCYCIQMQSVLFCSFGSKCDQVPLLMLVVMTWQELNQCDNLFVMTVLLTPVPGMSISQMVESV